MRSSLFAAVLMIASPVGARDLPVPADKGWQHAATQLILPSRLDGLSRTRLIDQTASEHDIAAEFADSNTVATIFIFHPAVDDVAMWFERSEAQIYNRERYGDVAPNSAAPISFAPPHSRTASGLRRIYTTSKSQFHTTGLAVMPLGEWLVAVRISGPSLSATALDARLSAVIASMRWPMSVADKPAATMIAACPTPLRFTGAKRVALRGQDVLAALSLGAMMAKAEAIRKATPPSQWCRDSASAPAYGVYRAENQRGYILALHDAGRVANVDALVSPTGHVASFRLTLADVDGSTRDYGRLDRLPSPGQVTGLLAATTATEAAVVTSGTNAPGRRSSSIVP